MIKLSCYREVADINWLFRFAIFQCPQNFLVRLLQRVHITSLLVLVDFEERIFRFLLGRKREKYNIVFSGNIYIFISIYLFIIIIFLLLQVCAIDDSCRHFKITGNYRERRHATSIMLQILGNLFSASSDHLWIFACVNTFVVFIGPSYVIFFYTYTAAALQSLLKRSCMQKKYTQKLFWKSFPFLFFLIRQHAQSIKPVK